MVGFYEYAWVTDRRRTKCYPWKHAAGKEAAQRLYERRLRQYTPETWTRDPYLVCIMLSLAQDEWHGSLHQSYPVFPFLFPFKTAILIMTLGLPCCLR